MGKSSKTKAKAPAPAVSGAGVVASPAVSPIATIRVIKAHDGLQVGDVFDKPREIAGMMAECGFWEIIK